METIRVGYVRSGVGQVTHKHTHKHISDHWLSNVEHVFSFLFFCSSFIHMEKTGVKFH